MEAHMTMGCCIKGLELGTDRGAGVWETLLEECITQPRSMEHLAVI